MKTRAIIYTRFSPRRNAAECESCAVQASCCAAYAERQGWVLGRRIDDEDASGADEYRPRLWEAIEALGRGDVLLVYKRDRLARNVYLAEQINRAVEKRGASIAAVSGDVEGNGPEVRMIRQVLAAIAEYERKLIAARTSHAMRAHMERGRRMGGKVPLGWRVDPSDASRMVPDEAGRAMWATIELLAGHGASVRAVAAALDERHPRADGKPWALSSVARWTRKARQGSPTTAERG